MADNQPWTIGRLLQWTTDFLKKNQADTPRLDAEVLLAQALSCQRIELYTRFEEEPSEAVRTAFRELVRRRSQGMPVAYLVGRREFYSLAFRVTTDVLIPRPETEFLVLSAVDLAKARLAGQGVTEVTLLDVGTGSGAIAVATAKQVPQLKAVALDISPAALEVARSNAQAHGVLDRIEFLQSDLLSALPPDRLFDLVASNPPYIRESEVAGLAREVRDYEPRQALVAGPRGTEVIEALLPQAAAHLRVGGHLLLEVSPMIHDAVLALLVSDGHFQPGSTIKDTARLPRVVQAQRR